MIKLEELADQTGWVALAGQVVGKSDTVYDWDERYWPEKKRAIAAGYELADDTDDFNLGYVEAGKLTWFGWMDEKHSVEGYASVAGQFGWSA